MHMGVRGMELQLLTEESNARGGKWYRFTHPVDNPFFSGNPSKAVGNCFTMSQNPNGLS